MSNDRLTAYLKYKDQQDFDKQKKIQSSFSYKLFSFVSNNIRLSSFVAIDFCNNIFLHFLDTIKVRNQAKSIFNDTSQYFKNNITQKGLIAGVTSASIGSAFSSSIFIIANDYFLTRAFKEFEIKKNRMIECFDWKKRILYSYILADICKLICFLPFEARKQRIQLSQKDYTDKIFLSNLCRSFVPLFIRDSMTRFITLGMFLSALQVVHSPRLKYTLDEIQYLIKDSEKNNREFDISLVYDYSSFHVMTGLAEKFGVLVFSCVVATFLTQPFDLLATKYLTQTEKIYSSNPLKALATIYSKDGGGKKIFLSGFSPRLSFNLISALNIALLYELFQSKLLDFCKS